MWYYKSNVFILCSIQNVSGDEYVFPWVSLKIDISLSLSLPCSRIRSLPIETQCTFHYYFSFYFLFCGLSKQKRKSHHFQETLSMIICFNNKYKCNLINNLTSVLGVVALFGCTIGIVQEINLNIISTTEIFKHIYSSRFIWNLL